jgi:hypothetical protein
LVVGAKKPGFGQAAFWFCFAKAWCEDSLWDYCVYLEAEAFGELAEVLDAAA